MSRKQITKVTASSRAQVGDGFPLRRALPAPGLRMLDPFLMLDHAGPVRIEPSEIQKGVDEHPHKGFETVSIAYQGELEHRDSSGNTGKIPAGGVQWMTAGSGLVHEEKHGKEFTRRGGTLEMIQLWVNLPARFKNTPPKYQDIMPAQIPEVQLPNESGKVRVIAGDYEGTTGAADTFTPINILDLRLRASASTSLNLPEGYSTGIYVVKGKVQFNEGETISEGFMASFSPQGTEVGIKALTEATLLVVNGEPLHEPVVSYGPFVMNTQEEIQQAFADFRAGKMGSLVH
jgi:redox-sensitive bicupin YhaK (pirin superfamily)